MQKKTMTGRREIRKPIVFLPDHIGEVFNAELASSDLQHRTHQSAHHSAQKPIGFDMINQSRFFLFPNAFIDRAKEGFDLGIPFRERGEILEVGDEGCGRLEFIPIECIRVEPGAICYEGVLLPVQVIPVFPAEGVVAAVGVGRHGVDALKNDVGGEDGVDVVQHSVFDNFLKIKMKKVLHGVDTAIGAGGAGKGDGPAVEDLQGFFDLFLDGGGVVLDLKSAIAGAFIGDFQEISGHKRKDRVPGGDRARDRGRMALIRLLLVGHGFELTVVGGVGEEIGELVEVLVRGEGPGGFEEAEFSGVRGKDFTERTNLPRIEALDFKCLAGNSNSILVLIGLQHLHPEPVDIEIRGEIVAVRVDKYHRFAGLMAGIRGMGPGSI